MTLSQTSNSSHLGAVLYIPDLVFLQEIQDDGPTDSGTASASSTLDSFTNAIFTLTGLRYSHIDIPPSTTLTAGNLAAKSAPHPTIPLSSPIYAINVYLGSKGGSTSSSQIITAGGFSEFRLFSVVAPMKVLNGVMWGLDEVVTKAEESTAIYLT